MAMAQRDVYLSTEFVNVAMVAGSLCICNTGVLQRLRLEMVKLDKV